MAIHVALNHTTKYSYDRQVTLLPQTIRLRPAPHCRSTIHSYSLNISPRPLYTNWLQDPQGNYLARLVFDKKVEQFKVEVDLIAEMTVVNPFDFFLEPFAERYPFEYPDWLKVELSTFLKVECSEPRLSAFLESIDRSELKTVDFLVELNRRLHHQIEYVIRMEPGVQPCEETLARAQGSCRDSAWLLVNVCRHLGLAARFVSGYLIQLAADIKSVDGPVGPESDFTDLHAWTEVYLPGAGWVGLDPTSGLLAGEGHIPLAGTPEPATAAPISGGVEECESTFDFDMKVTRILEDPRVTKPYTDDQWQSIMDLGLMVDERLEQDGVRLTMGGEPTFVSMDDMEAEEWNSDAVGPTKKGLALELLLRLKQRFTTGSLLHFGQGKWYPGETLPRWGMQLYWRPDGEPIWNDPELLADGATDHGHDVNDARRFAMGLADRLQVGPDNVIDAFEDGLYYAWKERRLPTNVDVRNSKYEDEEERERLARVFEQGITSPVGCVLPLQYQWWTSQPCWASGAWAVRSDELFLIPGDSHMGFRLPLQSLRWVDPELRGPEPQPQDPTVRRSQLDPYERIREGGAEYTVRSTAQSKLAARALRTTSPSSDQTWQPEGDNGGWDEIAHRSVPGDLYHQSPESRVIPTALCVEPQNGTLHIFMPPVSHLEQYLELVAAIELTAGALDLPVVVEGYLPPSDPRIETLKISPDPGVIEVNVHPARNWQQLVEITSGIYDDARQIRLGAEKFDHDGSHMGTGGGNHIVLGGKTPNDSPFLRRPDLLKSLLAYWHNHPSLSYLFSGKFIGPTSQAPRVDEGRQDSTYELQIALDQIQTGPDTPPCSPWLVDRVFRHLLVDLTGNTHRAEFCIDKLYSPDNVTGRLGLVEFRGFEMPPHARMSLTQQLLIRSLVSSFWKTPYETELTRWGTRIHDRFLLPHFLQHDFREVVDDLKREGIDVQSEWFAPHFEFRFPVIGQFTQRNIHVELRQAIEPWYVLGEEPRDGQTARYVDSSVEKLQVKINDMNDNRHVLTCNGRRIPLHPTGTIGEYVAGVRYRAWQPPSCLHPTIPVDDPLVFDLIDSWNNHSIGGCRYHVGHPGGSNPANMPVNANEAESRRAGRFFAFGHSPGRVSIPLPEPNSDFPMTLDLRKVDRK